MAQPEYYNTLSLHTIIKNTTGRVTVTYTSLGYRSPTLLSTINGFVVGHNSQYLNTFGGHHEEGSKEHN